MNKLAVFAVAAAMAPMGASAATVVVDGAAPYDVLSDTLFTGIVTSGPVGGAGRYVVDFFASQTTVIAVAEAAVTAATVSASFTGLIMSWDNGIFRDDILSARGVDTLTTVFDRVGELHTLSFDWTDSTAGQGFRFDVTARFEPDAPGVIPLPASVLMLLSALGGLGALGIRQRLSAPPV